MAAHHTRARCIKRIEVAADCGPVIAYTETEGGIWRVVPPHAIVTAKQFTIWADDLGLHCFPFAMPHQGQPIHSLRWANGAEWDCVNGWRDMPEKDDTDATR